MKVLFITNMYPVPDYIYFGIHVKEQIDAIKRFDGVEAEVYFINGRESKLNYFKSISEIKERILTGKFDLIHIHYGISGLFLLFFTPGIPVVITLHSGELFQKKSYINHLLQKNVTLAVIRKAKKIIVLNDDMVMLLNKYHDRLIKQPCGTDLNYFKVKSVLKKDKTFTIGFPGNKERKEKNYALFSCIIDQLKQQYNIEIIEFHNMKRDDVVLNLNRIDLLLMTSTVEGSPQIIKEAMACNKPIVSTAAGDVEYLLNGVHNCFVMNSFHQEDFLSPIKRIIDLPVEERVSDGRDQLLRLGLDAENVAKSIHGLYMELT